MDDGVKNHWTFSNGEQFSFVEPTPNRSPAAEKSVNQRKQKGSKRKCRHTQTTNTRSRKRNADKKRQFNQHAIKHLENVRPAAMCIEDKSLANMTRSAAGKGRRRKASLNRSLAAVGLSENQQILVNQCLKRGIHVIPVPAPGTSQTARAADTGIGRTAKPKRASDAGIADGRVTPITRPLRSSATAASFASPSSSTDLLHASKTRPPGGRNSHPATGSSHCCPWLITRSSQRAARRSRAGPVGNRQGQLLQAGHPRSSVLPSRQLGQCSHQTAATNPWKPGLPKVYKHACHEYSSTLFNIVE